jgi:hypothetical protein
MFFTLALSEAAVEPIDRAVEPKKERELAIFFYQDAPSKAY